MTSENLTPEHPITEPRTPTVPTLRDMLALEIPLAIKISPGGEWAALEVRTTHWQDDHYERLCYIHNLATGVTSPLTRTGNVRQLEWLDAHTLALLWGDADDSAQVWLYENLLGQGWQVTRHQTGVDWFMPFAGGLLFLAEDPERQKRKQRTDHFGTFTHFEHEKSASALYYVGLEEWRRYQAQCKAATEDEARDLVPPVIELSRLLPEPLAIKNVVASPVGDVIYLGCWPYDDLVYYHQHRTYAMRLDAPAALAAYLQRASEKKTDKSADGPAEDKGQEKEDISYFGELVQLALPRDASVTAIAPDGRQLLLSYQERDNKMYTRTDLWTVDAAAALEFKSAEAFLAAMRNISALLDEEVLDVCWTSAGIIGTYVESTRIRLARFSPEGQITPLDLGELYPAWTFDVSKTGQMGLIGANARSFPEAYVVDLAEGSSKGQTRKISDFGRAVANWELGSVETIRWTSKDGVEIEGVLRKPPDFDPQKQYPLAFIVHGGPSWFSAEYLLTGEDLDYYPVIQLLHKGVLILEPNYRGSIGRGQAFMELNVNNLGIGDLWDLESAIAHLEQLGWIDPERIGCMGWSQGGYISAFAGLHSKRFKAVSVGAGISDWYTYHISNDIPAFTLDYLSASPFRDRERYFKTAPISNLPQAQTPMLIQHGAEDRRVPLSNAMELYRGLQEMGVPVELFVFPNMKHSITRPREKHAVMHQNLAWFSHYLLGEDLKPEE
ncbi:MAG TPA: prolyl oligopeptidase family serine peptidase [Anaerolineae bacterium]|nr:prolyl oligopeptidase family serine peptidase [Anaerolineae bacterium]